MDIALRGTSPSTITAGIMLMTRARQLGFPLSVVIVGDETDVACLHGPAVVYAPVLASCGVGRELGSGATVVVPGPPSAPVMVTVQPHGTGGWFLVDRTGQGIHPATHAFVRLCRDPRPAAREQGRRLRRLMGALGMSADVAVLDVLFGAPVPPLLRIALALRAGRSMAGGRGESITRFLAGAVADAQDPLPEGLSAEELTSRIEAGELQWVLHRLSTAIRDQVEAWVHAAIELGREDGGRDLALLVELTELATHLAQLPVSSILPPLGAAEDSVAVGLEAALINDGDGDANQTLQQVYRFLGGRFVDQADHAHEVSTNPPPSDPTDVIGRWQWFCGEVRIGRKRADALFDAVFHPQQ